MEQAITPTPWLTRHRKALLWSGAALAVVGGAAFALAFLDWNMLRGPIGSFASARTGREVVIGGDLDVKLFSRTPSASVQGLQIGNPTWAGKGRMAEIPRLDVAIEAWPLLRGKVVMRRLALERPAFNLLRDGEGRANWSLSRKTLASQPLRLPPIRDFTIRGGHLKFADAKRRLTLDATLDAAEQAGAADRGFSLVGKGAINAAPFLLEVRGGPLLNIRPARPYPFDADIRAGSTRVLAKGAIRKPFDLGEVEARVTASGEDLADLYHLTGVPFPNSPPYRLSAQLTRQQKLWRATGIGGRVGDSDMAGELSVDAGGSRPFLRGDLRSRSLDFDDLAAVFGGAPSRRPGETVSAGQKATGLQLAAQRRLLPDAKLDLRRIRAIDADVKYSAAGIRDAMLPLRSGSVRVRLDKGLLTADPLRFDLPQGAITGQVQLNGRNATPVTSLDLRLSKARLEQLVPIRAGGATPLTGGLVGRVKLTGSGASVREAAAHADGQALVVVPGGEIRAAFAELLGVNVVKGLGLLLAKDQSKADLRCAVAHFQAKGGVLTANRIIFDTTPVLGVGQGTIDLRTEQLDFRISGRPKHPQLIRVMAPVTVRGPIIQPRVGVETSNVVAQGGIAAALGALVSPLAAVLPFVDLGGADDAACGALIAQAGRQGAPVKGPARR